MVCPGYQDFREDRDLSEDKDIVAYFKQVIKHRLDNVWLNTATTTYSMSGVQLAWAERRDTYQLLGPL